MNCIEKIIIDMAGMLALLPVVMYFYSMNVVASVVFYVLAILNVIFIDIRYVKESSEGVQICIKNMNPYVCYSIISAILIMLMGFYKLNALYFAFWIFYALLPIILEGMKKISYLFK